MNEFTKDELQTVLACVNGSNPHGETYHTEIRDKIQSLIDNYKDDICIITGKKIVGRIDDE